MKLQVFNFYMNDLNPWFVLKRCQLSVIKCHDGAPFLLPPPVGSWIQHPAHLPLHPLCDWPKRELSVRYLDKGHREAGSDPSWCWATGCTLVKGGFLFAARSEQFISLFFCILKCSFLFTKVSWKAGYEEISCRSFLHYALLQSWCFY